MIDLIQNNCFLKRKMSEQTDVYTVKTFWTNALIECPYTAEL